MEALILKAPDSEQSIPKQIYIVWAKYQRRPTSMDAYFGYRVHFVPPPFARWTALKILIGYPLQVLQTARIVLMGKPDVVWVQLPPNFLVHLCLLLRLLSVKKGPRLVADIHNSALAAPWLQVPFTHRLMRSFDLVLVHNEIILTTAHGLGVDKRNLRVLEDRSPNYQTVSTAPPSGRPCFVMPCSFHKDEPVRNVIEAARLLPDYDFKITGLKSRAAQQGFMDALPSNVTFTGFLPVHAYDALLAQASGILCLTTMDGVLLSAGGEAVGAGKPMIVSDFPLLRSLFGSACFVDNSVAGLMDACQTIAGDYARFAAQTAHLRDSEERNQRWLSQAAPIRQFLVASEPGSQL
ncbi:glycosyltransferase [Methylobacterium sp. Leaf94]|uniref:glycosyltransferase n=1 Tax=Methylobacterium sp. Leaf94 TaxID=1736250 RepID=UPI0009EB8BDA|nr:glycosyltransferase [Methylobacterium sp. Leaf94]